MSDSWQSQAITESVNRSLSYQGIFTKESAIKCTTFKPQAEHSTQASTAHVSKVDCSTLTIPKLQNPDDAHGAAYEKNVPSNNRIAGRAKCAV
jgi:hypothetical protein